MQAEPERGDLPGFLDEGGEAAYWQNKIETLFGIISRQSIRRGTFSNDHILVKKIREDINSWNENAKRFIKSQPRERSSPRSGSSRPTWNKLANNNSN